jgi:hypothetical protein
VLEIPVDVFAIAFFGGIALPVQLPPIFPSRFPVEIFSLPETVPAPVLPTISAGSIAIKRFKRQILSAPATPFGHFYPRS